MSQVVIPGMICKTTQAGILFDERDAKCRCATCQQGYMACPGHFGHIELAVPVYNPLVFP